eukprot:8555393-Lingulodinium_polyedra.AAC.1
MFYVQADVAGAPTRACLPGDQRRGKALKMDRFVRRLKKALYGHPDSGIFWTRACDSHAKS